MCIGNNKCAGIYFLCENFNETMDLVGNHQWTTACPKKRQARQHEPPDGILLSMKYCCQRMELESDQVFICNYHFTGNTRVRESCYHHGYAISKIQNLEN